MFHSGPKSTFVMFAEEIASGVILSRICCAFSKYSSKMDSPIGVGLSQVLVVGVCCKSPHIESEEEIEGMDENEENDENEEDEEIEENEQDEDTEENEHDKDTEESEEERDMEESEEGKVNESGRKLKVAFLGQKS